MVSTTASAVSVDDLLIVAAALQAGTGPRDALAELPDRGPLGPLLRSVAVGTPLATVARDAGTLDDPLAAHLLRALAVADLSGAPAQAALAGVVDSARNSERLRLLVLARTAQARMTGRVLMVLPLLAVLLTAGSDPRSRSVLASPLGAAVVGLAAVLTLLAHLWTRRLIRAVPLAALSADPLLRQPPAERRGQVATAVVVAVATAVALGPAMALPVAAVAWLLAGRNARGRVADRSARVHGAFGYAASPHGVHNPPTAEVLDLLAMALQAGTPLHGAIGLVASIGPPPTRPALRRTAAALAAGRSVESAVPPPLRSLGILLAATGRLGAPAAPALQLQATDLRHRAAAAAEEAAERLAAQLVFPTTLLLVPAFGLLVVVPPVVAAFGDLSVVL